ncbi:hypothetical protein RRG08_014986 [Elysia crispata]|uniref:Uncharacterized protein n=1 Tax=Elysia crispata TaxID=231223 RepID=A0AAE0ZWF3_9GAST|nr:hypothetical protein RRG08_014986 [Elysia crispata]
MRAGETQRTRDGYEYSPVRLLPGNVERLVRTAKLVTMHGVCLPNLSHSLVLNAGYKASCLIEGYSVTLALSLWNAALFE